MHSEYQDRISIAVWAVTLTLAVGGYWRFSAEHIQLVVGENSLALPVSAGNLIPFLLALLAGTGTEAVIRAHPLVIRGKVRWTIRFWALPIALTLITAIMLPLAPSILYWTAGLLVFAGVLSGVLVALVYSLDDQAQGYRRARLVLNLTCYLTALLLFLLTPTSWSISLRSLALGGVTLLLALELLRGASAPSSQVVHYSLAVGAIVAEVAWVLPLTGGTALAGSLLLLLLFYILVGLAWQHLAGRLTRRVALEFGVVGLLGLTLILAFAGR